MKVVTSLAFALAATLSAATAFAADKAPADKLTPQQQKLSDCAKDAHAKSLKGDEYKSYMSTCTKASGNAATADAPMAKTPATATAAETAASATASKAATDTTTAEPNPWVATPGNNKAVNAQQQKMKTCAADAKTKGLKGVDRRNYMGTCLKGTTASTPAATTAPAKKSTP